jgi:hypothetical protein
MAEDKRVVEARRDVAEARCQYCERTFKSPRGLSIHERACKEKERVDAASQAASGSPEESTTSVETSASQEAAEIQEELAIPPPDDQKGGLKVDFRMPDASLVSDPSVEVKQLIAQMEKERKRWEDERKKFLEQTESLLLDEDPYAPSPISEPSVKKGPEMDDVLLAEMNIAAELDGLKNELQKKATRENIKDLVESRTEVSRQLNDLDENVETLTTVLSEFSARTMDDLNKLGKKLDVKADEGDLKGLKEVIRKLDGKLEGLVDEVGHQESLDISKIPPKILELVYQTTLDDITAALIRSVGEKDAERAVAETMENVRIRTSGSEMFRYEYPRFRIGGLATSIEKGLISAKQVQMTYDEILKRLKEYIPHHQAKSFRAMIKVKSQEYAVERSSEMSKEMGSMQREVEILRQSISEISKSLSDEISRIASKLGEIAGKLQEAESIEDQKSELEITNGFIRPEVPQEEEEEVVPGEELQQQILGSIPKNGTSLTKMKKELDHSEEELQSGLDHLLEKGMIRRKKRGKGFVYFIEDEGGGSEDE